MNKKLTPLEAFKRIILCSIYDYDEIKEDTKIVENAIKRLEEKEHNCEVYLKQINGLTSKLAKYNERLNEIANMPADDLDNKFKVLEIIEKYFFVNDNLVLEMKPQPFSKMDDVDKDMMWLKEHLK